ncbi:MAG: HEPN domain-containing protein [Bacillota bacterium]
MTEDFEGQGGRALIVTNWWKKAEESLAAARSEYQAGRLSFAVNRLYFALFYAVTAVLAQQGLSYRKHTAVRAAFHRDFVRTRRVPESDGRLYDDLFNQRQQSDYDPLAQFDPARVGAYVERVEAFLRRFRALAGLSPSEGER